MDSWNHLRDRLMAFMAQPRVQNALLARHESPETARCQAAAFVNQIVDAFGPTDDADAVHAEDMLIGLLRREKVVIPTDINARRGGRTLNARQAVCLWLGARQTPGEMSGLWHDWERLLPSKLPIPDVIRDVFAPPLVEGGAQCYLEASRITLAAYIRSRDADVPLELPWPMADTHRRLAGMLLALTSGVAWRAEPDDEHLCRRLADVFGFTGPDLLRAVRDAVRTADREAVEALDAGRLLTWIIGTSVAGDPPHVVLENVENPARRQRVALDLLGGRTTLKNEVMRRLP